MRRALNDARINLKDVGHVNAHGTSTPLNDVAESRALRAVFGDHTDNLVVTSTKGVTGHTLGAAGAIEAIFAIESLNVQTIPPTANLTNQDPDIALDVVAATARKHTFDVALSTSMGFGGQNAALLFAGA